jgi:hypothetical protein
LIIVDNVVRNGAVADPASTHPAVLGVRRFHQLRPPNGASAPRRSRPSAAKDTMDSLWRWSSPTCSPRRARRRFGGAFASPRAK